MASAWRLVPLFLAGDASLKTARPHHFGRGVRYLKGLLVAALEKVLDRGHAVLLARDHHPVEGLAAEIAVGAPDKRHQVIRALRRLGRGAFFRVLKANKLESTHRIFVIDKFVFKKKSCFHFIQDNKVLQITADFRTRLWKEHYAYEKIMNVKLHFVNWLID